MVYGSIHRKNCGIIHKNTSWKWGWFGDQKLNFGLMCARRGKSELLSRNEIRVGVRGLEVMKVLDWKCICEVLSRTMRGLDSVSLTGKIRRAQRRQCHGIAFGRWVRTRRGQGLQVQASGAFQCYRRRARPHRYHSEEAAF